MLGFQVHAVKSSMHLWTLVPIALFAKVSSVPYTQLYSVPEGHLGTDGRYYVVVGKPSPFNSYVKLSIYFHRTLHAPFHRNDPLRKSKSPLHEIDSRDYINGYVTVEHGRV